LAGQIPEHQLDALAHMAAGGFDYDYMARVTGLKRETIASIVGAGSNEKFNRLKEAHQRKLLSAEVLHRIRLQDMQESCYISIRNAVEGNDKRLAAEQSWKVLDAVCPKKADRTELDVNVSLDIKAQTEMNQALVTVSQVFNQLKQVISSPEIGHVLTGEQALPMAIQRSFDTGPTDIEVEHLDPPTPEPTGEPLDEADETLYDA
jgi:hypothetical protein